DLRVYDQDGLLGISQGTTNSESVVFNGSVGDNYWVEVYGYQGVTNPQYSLNITTGSGLGNIEPDRFEPNNSREQATELRYVTRSQTNLSIHNSDDEDWFSFTTGDNTRDHRISI
ncbi:hypothetical protein, partial [Limnospira indica]|uniref:hypothetical protein n=1 Tax=Limnospira indica TaxID=147322 RepID=UPI0023537107